MARHGGTDRGASLHTGRRAWRDRRLFRALACIPPPPIVSLLSWMQILGNNHETMEFPRLGRRSLVNSSYVVIQVTTSPGVHLDGKSKTYVSDNL